MDKNSFKNNRRDSIRDNFRVAGAELKSSPPISCRFHSRRDKTIFITYFAEAREEEGREKWPRIRREAENRPSRITAAVIAGHPPYRYSIDVDAPTRSGLKFNALRLSPPRGIPVGGSEGLRAPGRDRMLSRPRSRRACGAWRVAQSRGTRRGAAGWRTGKRG